VQEALLLPTDVLDFQLEYMDNRDSVDEFVQQSRHQSVLIFANGAATYDGIGSAAAVLLPLGYDETEVEDSVTFSAPTCSHDMEVESIVLAMKNALKYYNSTAEKKQHEDLFILSDCQAAIDTVINHPFSHFVHPSVDKIRTLLRQLQGMSVTVSLTWIPGHTGIEYNEKADQLAKSALARQPDRQTETLTYLACKSLILRKINKRWQEKWDRLPTGRATHERLPTVGRKLVYPRKRCLAISYVRLLLDDTALKVHQHRMKLDDTRECVCGHGIEDEDHFFFHCHL